MRAAPWLILLALPLSIAAQDAPSLGDVARADRSSHGRQTHASAAHTWDEENVPAAHHHEITHEFNATIPTAKLILTVPDNMFLPRWSSLLQFPLPGSDHSASFLFGETSWGEDFQNSANEFVTLLLTRTDFRGGKFKLSSVEDTSFDGYPALLIRFQLQHKMIPHTGLALFVRVPGQVLSASCIYLQADTEKAGPLCDEVINSASVVAPKGEYRVVGKPKHY